MKHFVCSTITYKLSTIIIVDKCLSLTIPVSTPNFGRLNAVDQLNFNLILTWKYQDACSPNFRILSLALWSSADLLGGKSENANYTLQTTLPDQGAKLRWTGLISIWSEFHWCTWCFEPKRSIWSSNFELESELSNWQSKRSSWTPSPNS